MSSTSVNFDEIAEVARTILDSCTKGNERIGNFFKTEVGVKVVSKSVAKAAELTSKRVKNLRKAQEFAIWFANEYESKMGVPAPDKITNLVREVCVNLLTPYKRLLWNE